MARVRRECGGAVVQGLVEIRDESWHWKCDVVLQCFSFHIGGRIAVNAALNARGLNVQGLENNGLR